MARSKREGCKVVPSHPTKDSAPSTVVGQSSIRILKEGSILWPRDASSKLGRVFRSNVHPDGITWKKVPEATKECYWQELKKYITWDPSVEGKVRHQFHLKVQEAYNRWLYDIRGGRVKKGEDQINKTVLAEWRRFWASDDAKRKSEIAKKNRRRGDPTAPAESTHTGGSRSFLETSEKLGLNKVEKYIWAHTKDHNMENYINPRATQVAEDLNAIEEELTQQRATGYDRDEVFLTLVPRDKKNRIFGLGSLVGTVPPQRSSINSDDHAVDLSKVDE
ncbi:uncharacterized protein LOC127244241 [Andrographis paniculata]|uniref:uncharacterized protein LOC127244241 n=1 Tax=Andrographis paniculata TaxID=175694 RepID=UPI0021E716E9|nr:uncharacterized protein LOC127244241 [Andrographis paniculata]